MRRRMTIGAAGLLLALSGAARAQEASQCTVEPEAVKTWKLTDAGKDWEARPATPSYLGDTGLFHLPSAYTLPKGKASFSFFRDNLDRDPRDVDFSIHGISIGFGATDRLELFANIGLQDRINTDAPTQAGYPNDYPFAGTQLTEPGWQTGVGDVNLGAKFKFLDDYGHGDPVGLALRGYVKLPTADEEKGLGTGKASYGADLVLSKGINHVFDLHASIGYQINSDPDTVDLANAFKWGVGFNVPACRIFQLQAELTGYKYGDSDFDQTNPVDLVVGPVFWIKPGIFIRPAISWNLNFDDRGLNQGSSSYTGRQISIGFHPGTKCCEVVAPPPPPPPPENKQPTVQCEVERSKLLAGETTHCRATASDPDGDPLTYEWSASAGRVSGSGAEATFDSTGVQAPATVTVTVKVSDGRGGTASSNCTITIGAPEKKAEATTLCVSSGFPRNLSRLNNVDKACLDDVASRLKQDPRSRVIVVGHADSKERYPEVIARKRGEAIKDYLVKERGVEESRVSVRSAGSTRPLDTGTTVAARAKNRRVEVIFVPEGATAPEDDD